MFFEARLGRAEHFPMADVIGGMSGASDDRFDRSQDARFRSAERRPEVDVIEHLALAGCTGEVDDFIDDFNSVSADLHSIGRPKPKFCEMKPAFVDFAFDDDFVLVIVEPDDKFVGGNV